MSIIRRRFTATIDGDATRSIGSRRDRAWRRIGRAALIVAAGTAGLALAGPMALRPFVDVTEAAGAAGQVSVAFVLDFGTGTPVVGCVSVPASVNRYEALSAFLRLRSMAQPSYATSGLLCSINAIPLPPACGQIVSGGYSYWSYFTGGPGGWTYANSGASGGVTPGDVEGWRFQNPGKGNPGDPAPRSTSQYDSICTPGAVTASPGPVTNGTTTTPTYPSSTPPTTTATNAITTPTHTTSSNYPATTSTTISTSQSTSGTSPPAVSVPAAPVTALGLADHSAAASGPGSVPIIIGGLLITALGIAAFARWRRRPRTP